jgi:hypothetical protein
MRTWILAVALLTCIGTDLFAQQNDSIVGIQEKKINGATTNTGDTILLDMDKTEQEKTAVIENSSEPVSHEYKVVTVADQNRDNAETHVENTKFSLFDYGKVIAVGPCLSYFNYEEFPDNSGYIQSVKNHFQKDVLVVGAPKSTEYGALIGVNISITRVIPRSHVFIRPRFSLMLGSNTYDGSLQAQIDSTPTLSYTKVTYEPKTDTKTNIFLSGGLDLGYEFSRFRLPFAFYSGLDAKLWYRDLLGESNQQYASTVTLNEVYYWFNIPFGFYYAQPINSRVVLGVEPRFDFMFYGQMQVNQDIGYGYTFNYPAVTLGNNVSYRLEAFAQFKVRENLSLKVMPYVTFYKFGKSNTDTATVTSMFGDYGKQAFYEPASNSYLAGLVFQVAFLRNPFRQARHFVAE